MPRNDAVAVMRSPYVRRNGETPRTRVLDLEDAFSVRVQHSPDPRVFGPVVKAFAEACFCAAPVSVEPSEDVRLEDIVNGQALWQSMETLYFNLVISGCSRVFTHQLVRSRVGVTFSQQCFGENDARHADMLVHRCYGRPGMEELLESEIQQAIGEKMHYVKKIDGGMPLQAARRNMPHNIATFIYMHANLKMLAGLYNNRICTMSQDWEAVVFARKLKAAILDVAPWAAPVFRSACENGSCFYMKARASGFSVPNFYTPDALHDTFEWNPKSYVHNATNEEVNSGPVAVPSRRYVGQERIQ